MVVNVKVSVLIHVCLGCTILNFDTGYVQSLY